MAPHCMNVGITATVTEFSGIPAYTPKIGLKEKQVLSEIYAIKSGQCKIGWNISIKGVKMVTTDGMDAIKAQLDKLTIIDNKINSKVSLPSYFKNRTTLKLSTILIIILLVLISLCFSNSGPSESVVKHAMLTTIPFQPDNIRGMEITNKYIRNINGETVYFFDITYSWYDNVYSHKIYADKCSLGLVHRGHEWYIVNLNP